MYPGRSSGMKYMLFFVLVSSCLALTTADDAPVITTEEGKVSGIVEKATNDKPFYSYYSIPYASPPLGELRFRDPVEPKKWEGVRDGSTMPPMCLQVRFGKVMAGIKALPEELDGSEDCLFLNVFTPKDAELSEGNGLPVMVFIHGGGFFAGGAEEYLPHVLLSKDVVLVIVQYRLAILGFLSTDDSVIPGNFGLKDQTMALRWVQRNINQFGGDPKKVTIFGESAGAASVHYQMLTPKAKGLFKGAIMQSGNALCPWAFHYDHAKYAKEIGNIVGCDLEEEGSEAFLKCMQSVSANLLGASLQNMWKWFVFPMVASARIDGDYLPDHPVRLIQEGRYNKVNLISGVTADEGAIFSLPLLARPDLVPILQSNFEENGPGSLFFISKDTEPQLLTNQIYSYYLGGKNVDIQHVDGITEMMGDRHFKICHDLGSHLHGRHEEVSTYRYELVYNGQMSVSHVFSTQIPGNWVSHGDDLYYLFRGGPLLQPFEPPSDNPTDITAETDLRLREVMLSLWTNFASTGNPTPDDSLGFQWHATEPGDFNHLALSPEPEMAGDNRKEARNFANTLPTEVNRLVHPHLIRDTVPKSEL